MSTFKRQKADGTWELLQMVGGIPIDHINGKVGPTVTLVPADVGAAAAAVADKEMFPDVTYIDLQGRTVGNLVLTRTKVALGTITLSI